MRGTLALAASTIFLLTACVHTAALDEVPSDMRARLARHPMWLTIASLERPGAKFPPAELGVIKRWQVITANDAAVRLDEAAMSSFIGYVRRAMEDDLEPVTVALRGSVDMRAFFPYDDWGLGIWHRRKAVTRFRALDDKRFVLELVAPTKSRPVLGRVIFLPVPNDYQVATDQTPKRPIGVWTTPFGPEGEIYGHLRRTLAAENEELSDEFDETSEQFTMDWEGRYLHHDLKAKRRILVTYDDTVPVPFRASLAAAVKSWNDTLGGTHLQLEDKPQKIDVAECLSGFRLCVSWRGSAELEVSGASGFTEIAFDPLTGLITGGRIFVVNDGSGELKDPDKQFMARFAEPKLEDVAAFVLDAKLSLGVRHPYPVEYFKYLFAHELGHFHGFGHDFTVEGGTSLKQPARSIMAYPVFPLAHRMTAPTALDKERVATVYRGASLRADARHCSTVEALGPVTGATGMRRVEGCDIYVVGEPAEWYLTLAREGRFGVFTDYPELSQWSDDMRETYRGMLERGDTAPLNVLTHLGNLLAETGPSGDAGRKKIRAYLCGLRQERMAITAQLRDFHDVTLTCP